MTLEFHEVAGIFPLMDGAAFDELCSDIAANGLLEPIWTYEGKILDGRNRYRACEKVGVLPEYREYGGKNALQFVLSLNLKRRHLNESQRSMIAARLAKMKQGARTDIASIEAMSQPQAAELLNVSRSSVQRAKQVLEEAPASVIADIENGGWHGNQWQSANLPTAKISQSQAAKMLNVSERTLRTFKAVAEAAPELVPLMESGEMTTDIKPISQLEQALQHIETIQQGYKVEAMAAAAKAWAKETGDFEKVVSAERIHILARRKTTELIRPNIRKGQHGRESDDDVRFLADYNLTHKQWSRRLKELEPTEDDIEVYLAECLDSNGQNEPTVFGLLRWSLQIIGDSTGNEWWTPAPYIESARAVNPRDLRQFCRRSCCDLLEKIKTEIRPWE